MLCFNFYRREGPMRDELQFAADAVDEAWRRVKTEATIEARDAFDLAYARWEELCPSTARGIGRKVRGGDEPMTSSQRAQATRARQQQSAARWERVAPLIQQLRKAVEAQDATGVISYAEALTKETAMVLRDFNVIHAQPDSDFVVVHGWHDRQIVLTFIPRMHLEDYFHRGRLSGKQANLLVDRNIEAFSHIISAKYERGDYRAYSRSGSTYPRVDITLEDIQSSGESLTDSVLAMDAQFRWAG